jgi:molybdenum cofactor cytidylyltransferase
VNAHILKTAAVILAGGASRRMGSPKALLPYRGETFIDRLIGVFAPCDEVVVVLGHDADTICAGIERRTTLVVNPDPERGQLSSLQCGLSAVASADAIFFTPVDYPAIDPSTIRAMLLLAGTFAMPRHNGRRGHPVLIDRQLLAELLACKTAARDVIRAHEPRYIDVDDPGILEDIDDPAAYARLVEAQA